MESFDEAFKTYKQMEEKGLLNDELRLKVSEIESMINNDKLDLSELDDKKSLKSIRFCESIHTGINKSPKSSIASLRKIHKALQGICPSSVNNPSDEEKQNGHLEDPKPPKIKEKHQIKLSKSKFTHVNVSHLINFMEEVKEQVQGSDGDTPKKIDLAKNGEIQQKDQQLSLDFTKIKQGSCEQHPHKLLMIDLNAITLADNEKEKIISPIEQ
jgi:hypothetical protein